MQRTHDDIFNLLDKQPKPARGSILVAKPSMGDRFFKRSVIMLVDHDHEDGSMGIIVNKFTGMTLQEVLPELHCTADIPLYLGGPVNPEMLFFLHTLGTDIIPDSIQVTKGVYFGGKYEVMKEYIASGAPVAGRVKFILGYSGWASGQLDREIEEHSWAVLKQVDIANLMAKGQHQLWSNAVAQFGDKYRLWLNWPQDIADN